MLGQGGYRTGDEDLAARHHSIILEMEDTFTHWQRQLLTDLVDDLDAYLRAPAVCESRNTLARGEPEKNRKVNTVQ